MNIFDDLSDIATFGIAGNFTGHLEQAGEAADFVNVRTAEADAPKAIFPTYIPNSPTGVPEHLHTFPFADDRIIYPEGETRIQIEPECAILFKAEWEDDKLVGLIPLAFGASNDCSIRREGAPKISFKKNWGRCSKGFSANSIELKLFENEGEINDYRIASYLVRDGHVYPYGEDSAVRDYSYVYGKLNEWMLTKFNSQKSEGPAEDIHEYLIASGRPSRILVSIGATRYTEFGKTHFLRAGDHAVVVLYPESRYSAENIIRLVRDCEIGNCDDISVLDQVATS